MDRVYSLGAGTSERVKLTERVIAAAAPLVRDGGAHKRLLLDTEQRGFGVAVNAGGSKSYFVLRRVNGRQVRFKFRNVGEGGLTEARREAAKLLGQMSGGLDPAAAKRARAARGITLREAVELAAATMRARGRSARTIEDYRGVLDLYLRAWLDRPLAEIARAEVRARHAAIPREIVRGKYVLKDEKGRGRRHPSGDGRASANAVFRVFRAVYNRALREHPELPSNPCVNIDWAALPPHKAALAPEGLAGWFKAAMKIENPLRRDFLLFALYSGMRRQSVAEMRWADVDLARRLLRVPRPKGGEARAFDLPLSDALVEILRRRKAEHDKLAAGDRKLEPWAWPAASKTGHIAEPREEGLPGTIHDLRRVFITVATHRLKLHPYDVKLLVNHALPRADVTTHYVAADVEALRVPMQAISDALRALCEPRRGSGTVVPIAKGKRGAAR